MPLKRHHYDFASHVGNTVQASELDVYDQYQVINPAISATHFGSATAGTVSQVVAVGLGNTRADYPRNVAAIWSGSASVSGTVAITGVNQFGAAQTENLALAQGTQTAGTSAGTKVFARVSAATATFGTGVVGSGTVSLGVDIVGTSLLFGLPSKIAAVTDVKAITWSSTGGISLPINGGTVASTTFVSTTQHAFRGSATLAGTQAYTVLYRPTYETYELPVDSNLS